MADIYVSTYMVKPAGFFFRKGVRVRRTRSLEVIVLDPWEDIWVVVPSGGGLNQAYSKAGLLRHLYGPRGGKTPGLRMSRDEALHLAQSLVDGALTSPDFFLEPSS